MDRLARQALLAKLGVGWFWTSQILSLVGLASITDDLKTWGEVFAHVGAFLEHLLPSFWAIILWCLGAFEVAIDLWRAVFRPIFDLFFGWLPWDIPVLAKDVALVCSFAIFGRLRAKAFWYAARDEEADLRHRLQEKYGLRPKTLSAVTLFNAEAVDRERRGRRLSDRSAEGAAKFKEALGVDAEQVAREILGRPEFRRVRRRVEIAVIISDSISLLTAVAGVVLLFECFFQLADWGDAKRAAGEQVFSVSGWLAKD